MTPSDDIIRDAIQAARESAGMSVAELARRAEVPRANLNDWLNRKGGIKTTSASRVLVALGVELQPPLPSTPPTPTS